MPTKKLLKKSMSCLYLILLTLLYPCSSSCHLINHPSIVNILFLVKLCFSLAILSDADAASLTSLWQAFCIVTLSTFFLRKNENIVVLLTNYEPNPSSKQLTHTRTGLTKLILINSSWIWPQKQSIDLLLVDKLNSHNANTKKKSYYANITF